MIELVVGDTHSLMRRDNILVISLPDFSDYIFQGLRIKHPDSIMMYQMDPSEIAIPVDNIERRVSVSRVAHQLFGLDRKGIPFNRKQELIEAISGIEEATNYNIFLYEHKQEQPPKLEGESARDYLDKCWRIVKESSLTEFFNEYSEFLQVNNPSNDSGQFEDLLQNPY